MTAEYPIKAPQLTVNPRATWGLNKYDAFKVKFQALIASTNASLEEKAKTLYQALGNEVIMQLDHVPNLTDPEAYEKLWQSLDIEFGKFQHGHTD